VYVEATASPDDSEGAIREYVKSQLPRLIKRASKALLIEEMEVCSGRARVDLAVIAEHLIGIEIKGPKDDVTRLPRQAKAYSRCFDRVVLVIHESLVSKARPLIPEWWGIVIGRQGVRRMVYQLERRPQAARPRLVQARRQLEQSCCRRSRHQYCAVQVCRNYANGPIGGAFQSIARLYCMRSRCED
jgi:hypothetical protein